MMTENVFLLFIWEKYPFSNVNFFHLTYVDFIPFFVFLFWSTKLQKHYIIFCLSCKARQARKKINKLNTS